MSKNSLSGVITALVTPFYKGEVDYKSFAQLLHQQSDTGVKGFVINGTTGESPTLKFDEVKKLFEVARSELPQAALIVGAGLNSTAKTCELSQTVSAWKPEALLVVVPYYNRPPQRGLQEHFEKVAGASNTPILLYNVPSRTVAGLEASTIGALAKHPNIVGIKEATGRMDFLKEIRSQVSPEFILLSGDDLSSVEFVENGGHGVISVSSHIIGKEMIAAFESVAKKDSFANSKFRQHFAEFMKYLYIEANPIPVKAALKWMNVIASGELRLPLAELDSKFHKDFQACLKHLGKL